MNHNTMIFEIALVFFKVVGITGVAYVIFDLIRSILARSWPKVVGTLLMAEIREEPGDEGGPTYLPTVEYCYHVEGAPYKSTRLSYGLWGGTMLWLVADAYREAIKDHPTVHVRYNPRKPADSVLLVGVRKFHIAQLLFFVLWVSAVFTFG